jgi:hypothetical protein
LKAWTLTQTFPGSYNCIRSWNQKHRSLYCFYNLTSSQRCILRRPFSRRWSSVPIAHGHPCQYSRTETKIYWSFSCKILCLQKCRSLYHFKVANSNVFRNSEAAERFNWSPF